MTATATNVPTGACQSRISSVVDGIPIEECLTHSWRGPAYDWRIGSPCPRVIVVNDVDPTWADSGTCAICGAFGLRGVRHIDDGGEYR
jgi:hypothetical protein